MKKIMIIDDDRETLDLLNRILRKHYEIAAISDVGLLQSELNSYRPDLIIIDHFIGYKTSNEIIGDFKKQEMFSNVPVIIHSGHEHIADIAKASNASGFIKKPSGINEIRAYIDDHLADNNGRPEDPAISGIA